MYAARWPILVAPMVLIAKDLVRLGPRRLTQCSRSRRRRTFRILSTERCRSAGQSRCETSVTRSSRRRPVRLLVGRAGSASVQPAAGLLDVEVDSVWIGQCAFGYGGGGVMPGEEFLDGYFGLFQGVCKRNGGGCDDFIGNMPGRGVLADGGLDVGGEFVGQFGVVG